jgi:hypothetical protein
MGCLQALGRFASHMHALLQVEGQKIGFGNPAWRETHPAATEHSVSVQVGSQNRKRSNVVIPSSCK